MKLERNSIVAIAVGVTFAILLLFNLFTSGFKLEIKGILVSVYFAIWVGALSFVISTFIIPYIQERKKQSRASKPGAGLGPGATQAPFKSPRSGMPVRERIATYVAERRREDGLPSPEPLRPSRTPSAPAGVSRDVSPSISSVRAAKSDISASPGMTASAGGDLGDLPLPDDFGSVDTSSDDMGALPGLDDDFGGMDEFGGSDDMPPDFGEDNSGLLGSDDLGSSPVSSDSSLPLDDLSDGGLPGFDGDLDSDIGESDIMGDDSMMDLSGDDVLTMDDDSSSGSSEGGLSEAGLDLDDTLEPDLLDGDIGGDEDFGDIEFVDLEPDEPKTTSKK